MTRVRDDDCAKADRTTVIGARVNRAPAAADLLRNSLLLDGLGFLFTRTSSKRKRAPELTCRAKKREFNCKAYNAAKHALSIDLDSKSRAELDSH